MSEQNGVIVRIVRDRGFGFILSNEQEYFFHRSSYASGDFDKLSEQTNVTFEPQQTPKGLRAENVNRRIS